jgi:hypothetical protein
VLTDHGARVWSDFLMPSGSVIPVHLQLRHGELFAHDGGAAFNEMAAHGLDVTSLVGVRRMLEKNGARLTDDGVIWCDRMRPELAASVVSLVADASLRAAQYLISHGRFASVEPLDQRMKKALRTRYPEGRQNFAFQGKNREHMFDFGVKLDDRTFLVEAVTPDQASVSSAIVKGIDASQAPGANVVPLFVYDPTDSWKSGALNMLAFGGTGVSIERISSGLLPLAA